MTRTKWYVQNGTEKIINQAIKPASTDKMTYYINPASTLTPLGFLCVFITYL